MKKWKKFLNCILDVAVIAVLSACGNKKAEGGGITQAADSSETEANAEGNSETAEPEAEELEDAEPMSEGNRDTETTAGTESGKILVVYYSASRHTGDVAGYIAAATGGDTFELEPVDERKLKHGIT